MPNLLERLDRLDAEHGDVDYIVGIAKNARLPALATPLMERAKNSYEQTRQHARLFDGFHYASQSWPKARSAKQPVDVNKGRAAKLIPPLELGARRPLAELP